MCVCVGGGGVPGNRETMELCPCKGIDNFIIVLLSHSPSLGIIMVVSNVQYF